MQIKDLPNKLNISLSISLEAGIRLSHKKIFLLKFFLCETFKNLEKNDKQNPTLS